jgi:tRNA A-37 threonylcarbamoyl transferase component Bud32
VRAFVITVSIPNARPLAEFVKSNQLTREVRDMILRDLAHITRRAHHGRFVHRDLWVRNVLVSWQAPGRPAVWWIDSPKGSIWRLLTPFGKVLDLASLNKGAPKFTTRTERIRFLREYLRKNENGQLKKLARKVMAMKL